MLHGPRGNGKTVLLGDLLERAKQRDVATRTLTPSLMSRGEEAVARRVLDGNEPARVAPQMAGGGAFNVGGSAETGQPQPLALTAVLRSLLKERPVLIVVDEAHVMPVDLGRHLLQAVQDLTAEKLPLLLAIAGTPDIHENLRKMRTGFWERGPQFHIDRLESTDGIRQAFSIPAEQSGLPLDEDALALLVRECEGYPFFIQLLGAAAWNAAEARTGATGIELRDAQAGVSRAGTTKGDFFLRRHEEVDEHGLLDAATAISREMMARGPKPFLSNRELTEALTRTSAGSGETSRTLKEGLVNLGVVCRRTDGSWVPGIPSLCAYFVERDEWESGNGPSFS